MRGQATALRVLTKGARSHDLSTSRSVHTHSRGPQSDRLLAQEKAIEVYLEKTERYLRDKGATAYAGQTIDGIKGDIALTKGSLLAAAHREGAGNVVKYLDHLKRHNWISEPSTFPKSKLGEKFLHIETRLRTFQGIRHRMR